MVIKLVGTVSLIDAEFVAGGLVAIIWTTCDPPTVKVAVAGFNVKDCASALVVLPKRKNPTTKNPAIKNLFLNVFIF